MADKTAGEWTEAESANATEWGETVDAESQIKLEAIGEGFIATFLEMDETSKGIPQVHLENVYDLPGTYLGKYMFINGTHDLVQKLKKVPSKSQIRVEWTSSLPMGQGDPMRVYSVQWRQ